jgi:hypothetical protein
MEADRQRGEQHVARQASERAQRAARVEAAAERQRAHTRAAAEQRPRRHAEISEMVGRSDSDCLRAVIDSRQTLDYWPEAVAEKCGHALDACSRTDLEVLLAKTLVARGVAWKALRGSLRERLAAAGADE